MKKNRLLQQVNTAAYQIQNLSYFHSLEFIVELKSKPLTELLKPFLNSENYLTLEDVELMQMAINTILLMPLEGKELLLNLRTVLDNCFPEKHSKKIEGQLFVNHDSTVFSNKAANANHLSNNKTSSCRWATFFTVCTVTAAGLSYLALQNDQTNAFKI